MVTYTRADEVLWLLKGCGAEGMTAAAIGRRVRHWPPSAPSVDTALRQLRERGLVDVSQNAKLGGRILPDAWYATPSGRQQAEAYGVGPVIAGAQLQLELDL
jgi:hypothetical protein